MRMVLALLLLSCAGCFRPFDLSDAVSWERPEVAPVAAPRPITPAQVNVHNAHKQSQALLDELDRELNRDVLGPR
jgi:hypothetical protein